MTRIRPAGSVGRGLITRYALPRSSEVVLPLLRTQIARYGYFRGELAETLFDLPVAFADAVCLEPVNFCFIYVSIVLTDERDALHFSPAGSSVIATKPALNLHASASGNDLHVLDRTEDFKIIVCQSPTQFKNALFNAVTAADYAYADVVGVPRSARAASRSLAMRASCPLAR